MKPVAVIRFSETEGPGYFAQFLQRNGIPWRLVSIDAGDELPQLDEVSGIAMMGGPMSVNDPLPWIPPLLSLIRHAVLDDVPLIGHCLGGQMMAKALGGTVTDNQCKEMGWHRVDVVDAAQAAPWFGGIDNFTTFQWHYQTFSIPPRGTHLLRNAWCENQAFMLGPHIGFQCHIEMTADMVRLWCEGDAEEIDAAGVAPSVQPLPTILAECESRVAALNQVANRVYTQWIQGLERG